MFCAIEEPAGLLFELGQQVVPGVGGLAGGHFFGCAGNDQRAAAVATFRAEVNYVVGGFYHVEVMLDYHHCVAVGYEPAESISTLMSWKCRPVVGSSNMKRVGAGFSCDRK